MDVWCGWIPKWTFEISYSHHAVAQPPFLSAISLPIEECFKDCWVFWCWWQSQVLWALSSASLFSLGILRIPQKLFDWWYTSHQRNQTINEGQYIKDDGLTYCNTPSCHNKLADQRHRSEKDSLNLLLQPMCQTFNIGQPQKMKPKFRKHEKDVKHSRDCSTWLSMIGMEWQQFQWQLVAFHFWTAMINFLHVAVNQSFVLVVFNHSTRRSLPRLLGQQVTSTPSELSSSNEECQVPHWISISTDGRPAAIHVKLNDGIASLQMLMKTISSFNDGGKYRGLSCFAQAILGAICWNMKKTSEIQILWSIEQWRQRWRIPHWWNKTE